MFNENTNTIDFKHKIKWKIPKVPQSLNFSHSYLVLKEKKLISKAFIDESNFSLDSKEQSNDKIEKNPQNSKILSSRLSTTQFFHQKNGYFNEKIMRFNCIKNQDSFRTNQSEFIIEKPIIEKTSFFQEKPSFFLDKNESFYDKKQIFKEIHEEEYKFFHEPEVKFTENTIKSEENDEENEENTEKMQKITNKDENFGDSFRNESKIPGFFI